MQVVYATVDVATAKNCTNKHGF